MTVVLRNEKEFTNKKINSMALLTQKKWVRGCLNTSCLMKKRIIYILLIFCAAITSTVNAQNVTRTTQVDENNGFRWVLVDTSNGYGAETVDGKVLIPAIYNRIDYIGNLGYRDYFIVEDAKLQGVVTGFNNLTQYYQGIYSSNGTCIIPTSRGYSGICGLKSKDSNQLFYSFEIHFNGVEIEGVCDVHGKELWTQAEEGDRYTEVGYTSNYGFHYKNKKGQIKKLNIYLPSSDVSFKTYASNFVAENIEERIRKTPKQWVEKNGISKKLHVEPNNFRWYEVQDKNKMVWAENIYGDVVVTPRKYCVISFKCSNYIDGFFTRMILDEGKFRTEAITKEGNILIPDSRHYSGIYIDDPSQKYIEIQAENGVGIADLNGYEVVPPEYETYTYDGYDFEGTKENGKKVYLSIHKRPTPKQSSQISTYGGYYANMPWLMMPGFNYTPTCNYWNVPTTQWANFPVYGGVGDYVPTNTTDPIVNSGASGNSSRKCSYCNGTGQKAVDQSTATFGSNDPIVRCNICGRNTHRSTGHSHVTCGQCGGTGKAR